VSATAADAVVVGAGHNGLVAAILLARAGWRVTVLERADEPGGAIRTAEVTLPGFRHDLYAANLNLFMGSRFFAEHGGDLFRHGFSVVAAEQPFGSVFPDGRFVGVSTDPDATRALLESVSAADARAWTELSAWFDAIAPHLFPLLGQPMPSLSAARLVWRGYRALGKEWPLDLLELTAQSSRAFVEGRFESPEVRALVAVWGMHLDFPPDVPGGALFAFLETFASAANGMALGVGGARSLIDALVALLESLGGEVVCGAEAERIVVEHGRAVGVDVRDGGRVTARRAVIANLTPAMLFGKLLAPEALPPSFRRKIGRYRYAPGTMMVHLALDDLPSWQAGDDVRRWSYVHVGPYLDDMGLAYQQAVAGLLPVQPTLVVGQPTAVDPSRAPEGKHILWVQARVLPGVVRGDAAGEIHETSWDLVKDAYADRILAILERYAPGLRDRVLARAVLSPLDIERGNPNLVGGDHLGGSMHPAQHFFLRPVPGWSRYRTPIDRLYMCGAATWPGAGVGAGSGYLLARTLTRRRGVRSWIEHRIS